MAVVGGVGMITVVLMKEYPLQDVAVDQTWALQEKPSSKKSKVDDVAAEENEHEMDDLEMGSPTSLRTLGDDVIVIGPPPSTGVVVHEL
jgi:hypothetical protein